MHLDFAQLAPRDRYKLLVSVVVPRPIALVTSLDDKGQLNAAPFSFFNAMGSDPPLVALGVGNHGPGQPKDTASNIRRGGEFVVNLVDEAMAEQMNLCAVDFPPEISEIAVSGLTPLPATGVAVPRLAESPVNLECREMATLEIGRNRIILGQVLHLHIRDDLLDPVRLHVATDRMRLIGRMHGAGWYARTSDLFQMPRLSYAEWQTLQGHDQTQDP